MSVDIPVCGWPLWVHVLADSRKLTWINYRFPHPRSFEGTALHPSYLVIIFLGKAKHGLYGLQAQGFHASMIVLVCPPFCGPVLDTKAFVANVS